MGRYLIFNFTMKYGQRENEELVTTSENEVDNQVNVPVNNSFLATAQFWILVFVLVGIGAVVYVLINKKKQQKQLQEQEAQQFSAGQVHDEAPEKIEIK